jgi:hydrogenase large subunit
MALALDPNSPTAFNARHISEIASLLDKAKAFVDQVYIPDVLAVAGFYKEWAGIGAGIGNYMSYGEFPDDDSGQPTAFYLPRGRIMGQDLSRIEPVDPLRVGETVAHSYYTYDGGDETLKYPGEGETNPSYAGPTPPYDSLEGYDKYSWLKAPRYDGQAMEVGPLARMLVAYGSGNEDVKAAVDNVLGALGVGPEALFSTLGRIAARAVETQVLAAKLPSWLDQLDANMGRGNLDIADVTMWDPSSWPDQAMGYGLEEAPRGSLGHWVQIDNETIANYQLVVPSTWNGSPRDAAGNRGAWEEALIGTPINDPKQPVEVLRTVHSFDPCMACAVHVYDPTGGSSVEVRVV